MEPVRTLVVWCRDWPVLALDRPVGEPIAVVHANRVVATSASARVSGVEVGLRRREAQRRCPDVSIVERDIDREARVFDRVVAVLDDIAPRLEITRPGVCSIPTRGPSRYFGGDTAVADRVRATVGAQLDDPSACGVGIADGPFPATLAAQRSLARPGAPPMVIAAGASASFVAPMPVSVLANPGPCSLEFVDVLGRLGLARLSDLAAIGSADMLDRFGWEGALAHRLARGLDARAMSMRRPPEDLSLSIELDPPLVRVDQAAFVGKSLADDFTAALSSRGLAALRVLISVHTTGGAAIERMWRDEGALSAVAVAQRIRWQLDGWLSRPGAVSRGGICRIEIHPDDVGAAVGRQEGLWGGSDDNEDRARRAAARLQTMVGANAVRVPERSGGRGAHEQMRLIPIDSIDRAAQGPWSTGRPWPGSIDGPQPTIVCEPAWPADVVDRSGETVTISGRGALSAIPSKLSVQRSPWSEVVGWAGPWLIDERWWDPLAQRRRARMQMLTADGVGRLLALEAGRWWVEAIYD